MIGTFFALALWSIRNRLRTRFRRLREPRYLVGSIVGVVWFYFFVLRNLFVGRRSAPHVLSPAEMVMLHAETARFVAALGLFAVALVIGLWPGGRQPLAFTRAEVQFLFAAPITRRQLVHYKLLRSQLGLLISAAVATLLFRPGTVRDGWTFSVGVWIVLTTFRLYSIAVGLARGSLAQHGAAGLRRQWAFMALLVAALGTLGYAAAADASRLAALPGGPQLLDELRRIWSTGGARVVLWPFATLATLLLSGTPAAFASALPPALLMVVLAYGAVLRADTSFEEAAAAHAEKSAARRPGRSAPKVQARFAPFKLALSGPPELAILWKNMTLLGRFISVRTLLRMLPFLIFLPLMIGQSRSRAGVAAGILCLTLAGLLVLVGPQTVRNDLRQDLAKLAVIKSWPISGRALVRGELLAPTIVLSIVVCALILAAALMFGGLPVRSATSAAIVAHRASYGAAAIVAAPAFILAQLVVQNGLAMLFPAWMGVGQERNRGIEATGQRMLIVWGSLLATAVFLAPAAIGAAAVMFALDLVTHAIGVVAPAVALSVFAVAQSWLVTAWLGRVLDRTDVGAVEAQEE